VLLAMVLLNLLDSSMVLTNLLQGAHRCTPAPYGMLTALPTHSFGDVDPYVDSDLQFGLYARCRLVPQGHPHCTTVCKVSSAQLLQTNVALSPRALPNLHGLYHQQCHPIRGLIVVDSPLSIDGC